MSLPRLLDRLKQKPTLQLLLFWTFAAAVLGLVTKPLQIHGDAIRDLIDARDCAEFGWCRTTGPHASLGAMQGSLWPQLLAALWRLTQHNLLLIQGFVVLVQALAVALLAQRRGLAAGLLLLAALAPMPDRSILWQPSLLILPLTFAWLLSLQAERQQTWLSPLWLAISCDLHLLSWVLLPVLVLIQPNRRALLHFLLIFAGTLLLLSPGSCALNFNWLHEKGLVVPLVLVLILTVISANFASKLRQNAQSKLALLLLPWLVVVLFAAKQHGELPLRYVLPLLPGLCIAVALRLPRLSIASALLYLLFFAARPPHTHNPLPPLRAVQAQADELSHKHIGFSDVALRLQTPGCRDVAHALGAFLPVGRLSEETPISLETLQNLESEKGHLRALDLPNAPTSALQWPQAQMCEKATLNGSPFHCQKLQLQSDVVQSLHTISQRAFFRSHTLATPVPYVAEVRLPVAGLPADWIVQLLQPRQCPWQIVGLRGFGNQIVPPSADEFQLPTQAERQGTLILQRFVDQEACAQLDGRAPPCLRETSAAQRRLARGPMQVLLEAATGGH